VTKPKLRIGLIGSGFMGKAHAFGYANAARVFDLPYELELHRSPISTTRPPRRPPPRLALLARHRIGARWRPIPTSMS
jgi:predicted dehydrogenase